MHYASHNEVQSFRKRAALYERDLAFLLGCCQSQAARIESGVRLPHVRHALALQVLFKQQPRDMFPDLYEQVEDQVMGRAADMLLELEGQSDRTAMAQREFLQGLPRADSPESL